MVMSSSRRDRLRRWGSGAAAAAGWVVGHAWRYVAHHGAPVAGLVMLSVGAGQVYGPAGWITAGTVLLADRAVDEFREARGGARR